MNDPHFLRLFAWKKPLLDFISSALHREKELRQQLALQTSEIGKQLRRVVKATGQVLLGNVRGTGKKCSLCVGHLSPEGLAGTFYREVLACSQESHLSDWRGDPHLTLWSSKCPWRKSAKKHGPSQGHLEVSHEKTWAGNWEELWQGCERGCG